MACATGHVTVLSVCAPDRTKIEARVFSNATVTPHSWDGGSKWQTIPAYAPPAYVLCQRGTREARKIAQLRVYTRILTPDEIEVLPTPLSDAAIVLCARYTMSGTNLVATRLVCYARYEMSGTEFGYAATRSSTSHRPGLLAIACDSVSIRTKTTPTQVDSTRSLRVAHGAIGSRSLRRSTHTRVYGLLAVLTVRYCATRFRGSGWEGARLLMVPTPLWAYGRATPCPVLTYR
eukprot:694903-Rhodomonas_salina.4